MNLSLEEAREWALRARSSQASFVERCERLRQTPWFPSEVDRERVGPLLDLAAVVIEADPAPATCCAAIAERADDLAEADWWRGISAELARRGHG